MLKKYKVKIYQICTKKYSPYLMQIELYIDFESISSPFSRGLKFYRGKSWLPFAYSMGTYLNNEWQLVTNVINFKLMRSEGSILYQIKKMMWQDIRQWYPHAVESDLVFIGFSPQLEEQIISSIMPQAILKPIIVVNNVSLSLLTKEEFSDNYFPYAKQLLKENFRPDFIARSRLDHDGAIAAWVGMLMYSAFHRVNNDFRVSFDYSRLHEEFLTYSEEDVQRMRYIVENYELIHNRLDRILKLRRYKEAHRAKLTSNQQFLTALQKYNFNPNLTVSQIQNILQNDNESLKRIIVEFDRLIQEVK